ncbi:MAG TPA: hypothetical protein VF992_03645 [Thermoplasmata archaeon]
MTLATAARWDFENGWVDQLGSGMSQDTSRVSCDFVNHLAPRPQTALTIVAQLVCLSSDGGSPPVLRATVLVHFTVDSSTARIVHGTFLATSDADAELVVT